MNKIMVDTSFAYGIYDRDDKYHQQATAWMKTNLQSQLILPDVVLVEATYLVRANTNHNMLRVVNFLQNFVPNTFQLESVLAVDVKLASEIMFHYLDAKLDFVDCIISAQAERLNIKQICTFDRRDFAMM